MNNEHTLSRLPWIENNNSDSAKRLDNPTFRCEKAGYWEIKCHKNEPQVRSSCEQGGVAGSLAHNTAWSACSLTSWTDVAGLRRVACWVLTGAIPAGVASQWPNGKWYIFTIRRLAQLWVGAAESPALHVDLTNPHYPVRDCKSANALKNPDLCLKLKIRITGLNTDFDNYC